MKSLEFVQEMDFLAKPVDKDVVLKSAAMVGINPDHKHYGWVLEAVERGGFEKNEDLFEAIERVASKRSKEWGSLKMPTLLIHQHTRWMHGILVDIEGTYCQDCGCHGCLCFW